MPVVLQVLPHLITKTTLWDSYYNYTHLTDEKKEVQRVK